MVNYFSPLPEREFEPNPDSLRDSLLIWLKHQSIAFQKAITMGRLKVNQFLQLGPDTELTVASGVITPTGSYHTLDTESDASTDDLDTITAGKQGDILVLRAIENTRTIVVKDATGNIRLASDFSLDGVSDTLLLIFFSASWVELSRSNNG